MRMLTINNDIITLSEIQQLTITKHKETHNNTISINHQKQGNSSLGPALRLDCEIRTTQSGLRTNWTRCSPPNNNKKKILIRVASQSSSSRLSIYRTFWQSGSAGSYGTTAGRPHVLIKTFRGFPQLLQENSTPS